MPPEAQLKAAVLALIATAGLPDAPAGAAAAAADTLAYNAEAGMLSSDLLAVSRSGVRRTRRSLDAYVKFRVHDKSHLSPPLEHVVFIFPNFSWSDARKQLCCAVCLTFRPEVTSCSLKSKEPSLNLSQIR